MRDIIITGSSGLIGTEVTSYFKKTDRVKECDLSLGHDLNDESFVKDVTSVPIRPDEPVIIISLIY